MVAIKVFRTFWIENSRHMVMFGRTSIMWDVGIPFALRGVARHVCVLSLNMQLAGM